MDWDDLKTALALLRGQTLASAAADLGVSYTTVARRISRLEAALGETLFERLADGYRPTEAATLIAPKLAEMEEAQLSLDRLLAGQSQSLSGTLTVTAPQLLIAHAIAPAFAEFRAAHPEVALTIRATNELLDLNRREADVALRISRSPGDTLKGLRLAEQETAIFGTKDWAQRWAEDRTASLDWVLYSGYRDIPAEVRAAAPGSQVRYRFDDMVAIGGAVQAGLGLARLPLFLGRSLPGVEQVPLLAPQPYAEIWLVAHPDVWPSARVRAFRDVIACYVRTIRHKFVS